MATLLLAPAEGCGAVLALLGAFGPLFIFWGAFWALLGALGPLFLFWGAFRVLLGAFSPLFLFLICPLTHILKSLSLGFVWVPYADLSSHSYVGLGGPSGPVGGL